MIFTAESNVIITVYYEGKASCTGYNSISISKALERFALHRDKHYLDDDNERNTLGHI